MTAVGLGDEPKSVLPPDDRCLRTSDDDEVKTVHRRHGPAGWSTPGLIDPTLESDETVPKFKRLYRPRITFGRPLRIAGAISVTGVLTAVGCYSPLVGTTAASAAANPPIGSTADCHSVTTCYTPHQLEVAYGILPLLDHGTNGAGETVVLPELAEPQFPLAVSDIRQDMAAFDKLFHLPAAQLRVVTTLAPSASPWLANAEEVLDTEMVHTVAPGAALVEVLVNGKSLDNAANAVAASVAAVRLGSSIGGVISISAAGQAGGENCDSHAEVAALHSALQFAAAHHVTVVAASGDIGAVGEPCQVYKGLIGGVFPPVKEVNLPASDPLVLGAGGTSLTASHVTGAYISESAWGLPYGDPGTQFQASGGGISHVFSRPSYQDGLAAIAKYRGVPDVAADASPHAGMALVLATGGDKYVIRNSGGTSASAPIWAGIIALADQYAGRHLGFVNAGIYRIARSAQYHQAFHDVTTGDNSVSFPPKTVTGYQAHPGWDAVTGWGSPNAAVLVPLLKQDVHSGDAVGL